MKETIKSVLQNNLVRNKPIWEQFRSFSLWDMIQLEAIAILNVLSGLEHYEQMAKSISSGCASKDAKEVIRKFLVERVVPLCVRYELHHTRQQFNLLVNKLCPTSVASGAVLESNLGDIRKTFSAELSERTFLFVPRIKAGFFENDNLFGEQFHKLAPPEINEEIKFAGNCLACDLNTAAVFHLMRVAEYGLRQLARHLKVSTVKKTVPIEFGTWDEIIKALEAKISAISGVARGRKRQGNLEFYSALLLDMRGFKDFWRNNVMHTRANYGVNAAMNALAHVQAFMLHLSERINSR